MTAEDLARRRLPKRDRNTHAPTGLPIEQDDHVLMSGRPEVWNDDDSDSTTYNRVHD